MNKTAMSAFSLFVLIPFLIFAMIFPISTLSFSVISSNISTEFTHSANNSGTSDVFMYVPSDGSHPIGDYIPQSTEPSGTQLTEIPKISYSKDFLPDDAKRIISSDLSQNGNPLINDTKHSIDTDEVVSAFAPQKKSEDGPLVLVLHTHATESFLSEKDSYLVENEDGTQSLYYSPSESDTRSTNCNENVVHLGKIFCETLNNNGISAVLCETLHDYPDYNMSYTNSRKSVKEYLAKYPSIKYVVDLHRDSIIRENGEKVKPVCTIDGEPTAQIMLVMGSGSNHPNWKSNLSFALKFKAACDTASPGFSRPVYLRTWSFNQELSNGMIILEVGTCANSMKEAERAAEYASKIFAEVISH